MRLRSMTHGPIVVWTKRHLTNKMCHPLTPGLLTSGIAKIRLGIEMGESTGDITLTIGIRYGKDGDTWGSVVALGSLSLAADGSVFENDFAALPGTQEIYCQIGVLAVNTSVNPPALEFAKASLRIETRSC